MHFRHWIRNAMEAAFGAADFSPFVLTCILSCTSPLPDSFNEVMPRRIGADYKCCVHDETWTFHIVSSGSFDPLPGELLAGVILLHLMSSSVGAEVFSFRPRLLSLALFPFFDKCIMGSMRWDAH